MPTSRAIIAGVVGDDDAVSVLAALAEGGYGVVAASPPLPQAKDGNGYDLRIRPWRNPVAEEVGRSVLSEITRRSGWPAGALLGRGRSHELNEWRHVAMTATRRVCGASYPAVGEFFDRDHSTVMYAVRKIEASQVLAPVMVDVVAAVQEAQRANGHASV